MLKSVEGYILRKTEAVICFIHFPTNFSIVPMAVICYSLN